jgi:amino acid transporter
MPFIRSIGRWSLVALTINCIIGSGIFGVPGELIATVGRASPIAMLIAGLLMGVIMLCFAEVGSQFSEPGGVYLYSRSAFGKLVGLQVGWFWFLSALGGAAANANLFVIHLSGFAPWAGQGWPRLLIVFGLLAIPAAANYAGTRKGTALCNVFTVAKLTPLALIIVLGLLRFSNHFELVAMSEITAPGWAAWGSALLMLSFTFSGFEDPMTPAGEVKEPRRTIPFSLIASFTICVVVYILLQFVVVATLGTTSSQRPLAATAEALLGRGGALLVEIAAMISTYGWISASMLNVPRFLFSLSSQRELPAFLGRLHPRFHTPHAAVVVFALLAWLLTVSGTFKWSLMVSAGAGVIFDLAICAAVLRLRYLNPAAPRFRLPFGGVFSIGGMCICLVMLSNLKLNEALLMTVTAATALVNWWCMSRKILKSAPISSSVELRIPVSKSE